MIPSRGGRERLPRLMQALSSQSHADWDAVVVLDGDIDGSRAVLEEFDELPLTLIEFPDNRGRVAALNAGFAAATGDVLIRCDDDFEPGPGHVAAHLAAHAAGEPVGAVGLPLNIAPDNAYMRAYGSHADRSFRNHAYGLPADQRWRLWGGNVSVTRATFDQVGGYDATYQGYGWEDVDFGHRLHQLGVPIVLVSDAEVLHHMASVTCEIRALRGYDSGRARRTFDTLHGAGTSGDTAPSMRSPWNVLVGATARVLSRSGVERLGRAVDLALPVLPRPIGRKAVAWVVESAVWAGYLGSAHQ
ncbi:glycosyltransferase family 2 protein [Aestuariimicrobium ganziense]|uniref:glycosyltransferase family 2 protein n=1 Tax=Aestuariimicrobium ganziense TaxID=2773677 RepID=UPI002E2978F1|nr:glycosyltransferase family A protein [Aestuariimicrobium ganziense]